jgi:hypothetical protein
LDLGPSAHLVNGAASTCATAVTATQMARTRSLVVAMAHIVPGNTSL